MKSLSRCNYIYIYILAAFSCMNLNAADYNSIVLRFSDGTTQNVQIENSMTAKLADAGITFSCDKGIIDYTIDNVRSWSFSTENGDNSLWARTNGINFTNADKPAVTIDASRAIISNLPNGSIVRITNINGRIISTHTSESSICEIDLSNLSQGVYIITYPINNAIKISVAR